MSTSTVMIYMVLEALNLLIRVLAIGKEEEKLFVGNCYKGKAHSGYDQTSWEGTGLKLWLRCAHVGFSLYIYLA